MDEDENLLFKGRVAKKISGVDIIILTELLFSGRIKTLTLEEMLALFSILITQTRAPKDAHEFEDEITPNFYDTCLHVEKLGRDLINAEKEAGFAEVVELNEKLNYYFYPMVYCWAKKKPFGEILLMNKIDEGTFAKMIMQVEKVCKHVKEAAQIMGDADLAEKMDEAMKLVHRDIIFTPSLYLQ